jgi:hypothetical protein
MAAQTPPKSGTAPRMTDAQRAYEARRAAKAGMTLEKWLAAKEKEREEERRAVTQDTARRATETSPAKKRGFFQRLLEKAQQPLKGSR